MSEINKEKESAVGRVTEEIIFNGHFNDHELFSKLYDHYSTALFGFIVNRIKDRKLASTVLENVFLKAWQERQFYSSVQERVFTWLYKITRDTCTDYEGK